MPERFLLQILRNLVTHGILRSTRGVEGGYTLMKPPEEISLLDIIEAIEGPMAAGEIDGEEGFPPESQVRLNEALDQLADTARRQLESIKFSELLAAPPPPAKQGPRHAK